MEKSQPVCWDRIWKPIENETRVYCLDMQRTSSVEFFVSAATMECLYGEIFIPPTEISPLLQWDLAKRASPPSHMNRNKNLCCDLGWGEISAKSSSAVSALAHLHMEGLSGDVFCIFSSGQHVLKHAQVNAIWGNLPMIFIFFQEILSRKALVMS